MTPHETALLTILLERLKKTDSPDKDAEAETLIRQTTAEQPGCLSSRADRADPGFEFARRTDPNRGT
jgi:hypothetical protein